MGISRGTIKLLGRLLGGHVFERAVSYGVQTVLSSRSEARQVITSLGHDWIEHKDGLASSIFTSLGCKSLQTIDFYPNENPTYLLNLNLPVAESFVDNFDLIYDGGTLEHCFNLPEVLRNTAKMLRLGGRVVHHNPLNNWVDHGFYQICPTLFFDFYSAAGFSDLKLTLHFIKNRRERQISHGWPHEPLPYGIGNGTRVLSFFTAIKSRSIDINAVNSLIQSRYRQQFELQTKVGKVSISKSLIDRLSRSFKKRTIYLRAEKL